jgi:GxxExxY protein
LGGQIPDACIQVHKELGPGLLESVYHFALLKEFEMRGIRAASKVCMPLLYKGHDTGKHFEIDLVVEKGIILELKSVDVIHPVFEAQLITYLKLAGMKLGYLVNFNVPVLKSGFKRFVNNF